MINLHTELKKLGLEAVKAYEQTGVEIRGSKGEKLYIPDKLVIENFKMPDGKIDMDKLLAYIKEMLQIDE